MSAEKRPIIWAIFSISGPDIVPEGLNLELGVAADRILLPAPDQNLDGIWQIHSSLPAGATLNDHVRVLLERIAPLRQKIKSIAGRFSVHLEIYASVQKGQAETAELEISPELLLLMGHLGIHLAVELE
ncbi:MAG: DUF4279 domain-containing protein [Spirochaetales bacterium]|nr:DUF4279 domain-containing protein [Spirochaetales bacterium]